MLAVALSCVAWQARQPVPRRLLSGTTSDTAKVPIGHPGTADMPLRVVGASTIHRMRPVDMALGSGRMIDPDEGLGLVFCYAFPHVALIGLANLVFLYDNKPLPGWNPGLVYVYAKSDILSTDAHTVCLSIAVLVYVVVNNAVGEYIADWVANLYHTSTLPQNWFDLYQRGELGEEAEDIANPDRKPVEPDASACSSIASSFGLVYTRVAALALLYAVPVTVFGTAFGNEISSGIVYLSFTDGVGRYLFAVFFPIKEEDD
jgi:hypothetical protein